MIADSDDNDNDETHRVEMEQSGVESSGVRVKERLFVKLRRF